MCAVSMITDHFRQKWPMHEPMHDNWTLPATQPFPIGPTITWAQWHEYQELKRKAQEYDARTGQPDCEKPDVADWEAKIESYLQKRGLLPAQPGANS